MRTNQATSRGLSLHTSFSPDRNNTTITSVTDCYAMPMPVSSHPPGPSSSTSTTATPLSSTTASPTSSPTSSPFPNSRHHHFHRRLSLTRDPISLTNTHSHHHNTYNTTTSSSPSSRSQSPFRRLSSYSYSSLLRRPSLMLLRRRPSKVDMALCEERSRCGEDAIERQGLDLMEPRPVDPLALSMDSMDASVFEDASPSLGLDEIDVLADRSSGLVRLAQPRFVMGGIFEVMEGRG
ncbi:hypothetical protein BO70DRAFT_128212 [Aspergillus heteromorphus CBS 117.55]|uniref:Uncharacterized protein n=1 Tax=Aspergillus heteromorphus CBS 117.55 TaxID=1448321 RepID=A0A317WTN1_9EURO|nr:uncharacterized protein BO70DRAFT_128212 [Aspergillus heteromorphus CBS 117.55]PWY89773.1 hypothetical protein BO70DRAFT_128212 [Aspergillus heteromorphus CBS 117.55]